MFNSVVDEIAAIKRIWPAEYWDIRDEQALYQWLTDTKSKADGALLGELYESAKEFVSNGNLIGAALFFRGRWQSAAWFERACDELKILKAEGQVEEMTAAEIFIRHFPELIGGELWDWLDKKGVFNTQKAA